MSSSIKKLLQNRADIIVLTETGQRPHDQVHRLEGFRALACSMRPHDAEHGGVAVYVRLSVSKDVSLVKEMPEFGMCWFKITSDSYDTFACACYLPHKASSYYRLEDGNLDMNSHFATLQQHIAEFSAQGHVVILGDLNARTGTHDDRGRVCMTWSGSGRVLVCQPT